MVSVLLGRAVPSEVSLFKPTRDDPSQFEVMAESHQKRFTEEFVLSDNRPDLLNVKILDEPSYIGNAGIATKVPLNHPSLGVDVKRLIPTLWAIILSKAIQAGLRATSSVDLETDKDENINLPVLRVYLNARAPQALAFWDGLDFDIDRWLSHLNSKDREVVQQDFGLRIHWLAP